jgi:hypothetical protein
MQKWAQSMVSSSQHTPQAASYTIASNQPPSIFTPAAYTYRGSLQHDSSVAAASLPVASLPADHLGTVMLLLQLRKKPTRYLMKLLLQ